MRRRTWTLWREEPAAQGGKASAGPAYMRRRQFTPNELRVDFKLGRITARIARGNVQDVILDLCDELKLNYYFQSPVNLTAGVWVDGTDFETLFWCCSAARRTAITTNGIWISERPASDGLSSATVLPPAYRSVRRRSRRSSLEALKQNVAVKTFRSERPDPVGHGATARVRTFPRPVTNPVPMVTMEILTSTSRRADPRDRSGGRRGRQSGEDLRNVAGDMTFERMR